MRIFTNVETAQAYQNLFEDLFRCIEKDIGETFNFHHIHGKGLGCILADQHKRQALGKIKILCSFNYYNFILMIYFKIGLGQFLNSRYSHLTPIKHLQYIYKLC